jgi:hypothetical protein
VACRRGRAGRCFGRDDTVAGTAAVARQKAASVSGAGKSQLQAKVAPVWDTAPELVRRTVAKGASTVRQRRVPLATALAGLIVCYLAVQRWRKR